MGKVTSNDDWAATGDGPEQERRSFVEQVRHENESDFGPPARQMVETMLAAGHPHPWAYVYELSQNAIDAGARRISWRTNGRSVFFQHDGDGALDEDTVRGLSSIGASTKGQDAIGFMGVGFKSVFNRFRTARVSGFGWRIKFDIGVHHGALDTTFHDWFDALRPHWDPERLDRDDDYTTAFTLTRPVAPTGRLADDLARLASADDPTPLSVLALRGLEQVCIDDVTWDLSVRDGVVEVRRTPDGSLDGGGSSSHGIARMTTRCDDSWRRAGTSRTMRPPGRSDRSGESWRSCPWTRTGYRTHRPKVESTRHFRLGCSFPSDSICKRTGSST